MTPYAMILALILVLPWVLLGIPLAGAAVAWLTRRVTGRVGAGASLHLG